MNTKFLYSTVTSAMHSLRDEGFMHDFSLQGNHIVLDDRKYDLDDVKIISVHRYEGASDPADEASVYGLQTKSGLKGILVTGGDADAYASSRQILKGLHSKLLAHVGNGKRSAALAF